MNHADETNDLERDALRSSISKSLYDRALKVLPGGVSRNLLLRHPNPDYVAHAQGCRVTDIDGVTRIDFANNTASLIHGHAYPAITNAVTEQLAKGTAFSMPTEIELRFAEHLCSRNQGFEKVRFVNSGTEAVMAAIKIARAMTRRPKIAKVEGAYHGTYDYAEVSQRSTPENWGSPSFPQSVPASAGMPASSVADVVIIPFNDIERSLAILDSHANELAGVLIDPVPHRAGLVAASSEFVSALRQWTHNNGSLLIFDEVITFRMGYGGAQDAYKDFPDLTALGKIIGGGFPVGALVGNADAMDFLNPMKSGAIPFSGTFAGNPITMTAGWVAMQEFDRASVDRLNRLGEYARERIAAAIESAGAIACVTGSGSMFRVYLKPKAPTEYRSAFQDSEEASKIACLVNELYRRGFLMINTCAGALSTAMSETEVDQMVDALASALGSLRD